MIQIVKLNTSRDYYSIKDAAEASISVGELIDLLRGYDSDMKVVFSNDNGYTYGVIGENSIAEEWVKTREEEDRSEKMKELDMELCNLQTVYENPEYGPEEKMSDEEYRKRRALLFKEFGVTEEEFKNLVKE